MIEARSVQDLNNASGMMMNYMQMGADATAGMIQADLAAAGMYGDIASTFMDPRILMGG